MGYNLGGKDITSNKAKDKYRDSTNGKPIYSILVAKFGFIFLIGKIFLENFLLGPQKSAYSVILAFLFKGTNCKLNLLF